MSRIPYKLKFYRCFFKTLEKRLRDGEQMLVLGDFNGAHEDIDLVAPARTAR